MLTLLITFASMTGGLLLREQDERHRKWRVLIPLVIVFTITAVVNIAGLLVPDVLSALERDGDALANGQIWRIVTPLLVQDGGRAGTIFNLVSLLVLGGLACLCLGPRRWLTLYLLSGLASEVVAYTLIQQGSAGNSIANVGVAGGLAVATMFPPRLPSVVAGGATTLAGAILLLTGDLHGAAFAIGVIIAVALRKAARS